VTCGIEILEVFPVAMANNPRPPVGHIS
jgi:hypothetical protein